MKLGADLWAMGRTAMAAGGATGSGAQRDGAIIDQKSLSAEDGMPRMDAAICLKSKQDGIEKSCGLAQ